MPMILLLALVQATPPAGADDARTERTAAQVLDDAETAFVDQEYERTLMLVEAVLARGPLLTIDERKRAYKLEGMALAIARGPEYAEPPFRLLLRLEPSFSLDPTAPPKVLMPFKRIQAEERALREQETVLSRQRLADQMRIDVSITDAVRGGKPVPVYVEIEEGRARLTDVSLQFRRRGKAEVSRFGFERRGGRWFAEIPGGLTASSEGFVLETWVSVSDDGGILKSAGSPEKPFVTYVASGEVDDNTMLVGLASGAGLVAGATLLGLGAWFGTLALLGPPASDLGTVRIP